jgi:cyclic pyranopterin phosphate synthase
VSARRSLPVVTSAVAAVGDSRAPFADPQGRRVSYLRVSLTDRCNYRCTYCMPEDGVVHGLREDVLSFEEIERLVRLFVARGVRRVRLTGGEPTVRRDLVTLVARLTAIPDLEQVVMTTNGHLLAELAAPLAAAGLRGVNVSIDSLDPARFQRLTGRGDLARVQAGIVAARAAGLRLKLNAVALAGENDGELGALCRYAWAHGAEPRFIEWMPMAGGAGYRPAALLGAADIRARLVSQLGGTLEPLPSPAHHGPARRFRHPEGELGLITPMTEHFCDTCNRVRLSATGALHACLGHDDAADLRGPLRAGASDVQIAGIIAGALGGKRPGHDFQATGLGGPKKAMVAIGG